MIAKKLTLMLLMLVLAPAAFAGPLQVMAGVGPLKTFVERIGGDRVEVGVLVAPGHDPHTYDPTPRQVATLARADLYVAAGIPFETAWMRRIRATNPRMVVVNARDETNRNVVHPGEPPGTPVQATDQGHGPPHEDAHIWTDPMAAKRMATAIGDALARLDPANADVYGRNRDAFAAELDALDQEIQDLLAGARNRSFLVYHPAWGHFAARYGLTQVAIERDGKEPGARALTTLINQARRDGVRVVFVQPQFDTRPAARVAEAIGGQVVVLDPLAADYIANLGRTARLIAGSETP